MYTISQGRLLPGERCSRMIHLATTDSFMAAVHMAQLAGGAMITSATTKTHVGRDVAYKPQSRFLKIKPMAGNLIMMMCAWLLSR